MLGGSEKIYKFDSREKQELYGLTVQSGRTAMLTANCKIARNVSAMIEDITEYHRVIEKLTHELPRYK